MCRDDIIRQLKEYQKAEKDPKRLEELAKIFLSGINPRILEHNRLCAECAVYRVLREMFATPVRPLLCLEAMLQLCRDDPFEFAVWKDTDLLCSITREFYFSPMKSEDMVPDTQVGVV